MDATLPWHEPRPIGTLPSTDDYQEMASAGLRCSDHILVYNPCDGWHLLWLMQWSLEDVHSIGMFTWWMPGPPPLKN